MTAPFLEAFDLSGKTAVVTGASRGIGLAIAQLLAERGANQVLVAAHATVSDVPARLAGGAERALGVVADVSVPGDVDAVIAAALARFGGVDILVNNAGVVLLGRAEALPRASWDRTLAVNLTGAFLMAQAAGKVMIARRGGRIVNVASQAAVRGFEEHVAYCASKAGMLGLTRVLALEWARHGITVNAISPTIVETDMARAVWSGEAGEAARRRIPAGRFARPDEIAAAVLYLVSGVSHMITGENLYVDGGYSVP
ncbi:MAG TPA: D-threitol dehydrogenase [Anaeromyxobacteraceae bacterium]|nr:D-threitol dehydrogenase [Anaeromyxobacteraceae bacterium]